MREERRGEGRNKGRKENESGEGESDSKGRGEDPKEGWPRDPARQGLGGRAERRQSPQAAVLGSAPAQRRSLPAVPPAGECGGGRRDARGEVPSKRSCVWQVPRFCPRSPLPAPTARTRAQSSPTYFAESDSRQGVWVGAFSPHLIPKIALVASASKAAL